MEKNRGVATNYFCSSDLRTFLLIYLLFSYSAIYLFFFLLYLYLLTAYHLSIQNMRNFWYRPVPSDPADMSDENGNGGLNNNERGRNPKKADERTN